METPGPQVSVWLQAAHRHVLENLCDQSRGERAPDICHDVIKCLQTLCPQLPLSYSFTPISQLVALQHSSCVSLLGWDTDQFHRWSEEGLEKTERAAGAILPRTRLLLLGYLCDRTGGGSTVHDGNLYVRDGSGCVACEMTHFDLSLLGSLVLLPCWSYIPTPGGGYVEVLSPPIPVTPGMVREEVAGAALAEAITPESASLLLRNRSHPQGFRISVTGQLSSVTSLVEIRHKTFFSFLLKDSKKSVPVIVQVPSKLCWYHALHVGDTYEVTSLSVSSLHGSSLRVLAATSSSHLLSRPPLSCPSSTPLEQSSQELIVSSPEEALNLEEILPGRHQERARERQQKESKTLTYQGIITCVRDARAGLYVLDESVLLCTAFTQLRNRGRGLRVGARVEVFEAHLQQSPSPLFPTLVVSCCLRSRVRVCEFSRFATPCSTFSGAGSVHLHLLFRYRLTLPEYLWVCSMVEKLQEKLSPHLRQRCLKQPPGSGPRGVTEDLLYPALSSLPDRCERDLQEEMLAESHNCPLREYTPLSPPWCLPHLSLIPSLIFDAKGLQGAESNRTLYWCHYSKRAEDLSTSHVLLGVLLASSSGSLQLKDQSSSLTCLILPRPPIAWLGCVLEVRHYQLVRESFQDREKDKEPRNMTYAVFLTQDVRVLHSPITCPFCPVPESKMPPASKLPRLEGSWAQRHLLVESLEGRMIIPGQDKGLQFQVRASWVDAQQMTFKEGDREPEMVVGNEESKHGSKVVLRFSSTSLRWFNFLQPDRLYRITATGEMDSGIFDLGSSETSCIPQCLNIHSAWTLEDSETTGPPSCQSEGHSIEEALKDSPRSSLLSVTGVVSSRSMCYTQSTRISPSRTRVPDIFLPPGVSLKVILTQPDSQSSASVYLDLFQGPYPLGLLPGASVFIHGLERKVSRSGRVYLRSVPTTYVRVLGLPAEYSNDTPDPQLVLFKNLSRSLTTQRAVCTVTFVLSLTLHWDCSTCGSTFIQSACDRSPSCSSQAGVFRANACVKAEDGSGEVHLYLQDEAVSLMLGVSHRLWEALQGRVLARGKVTVKCRGRNELPCEEKSEDTLMDYLTYLMSRPEVSRPLILTFRERGGDARPNPSASVQLTHFRRGEQVYVTRIPSPPIVTCVQLQEMEPRALCHMIRDRSQSSPS